MESSTEANPADLCRVCTQDVSHIPSKNIFEFDTSDCLNIYNKLKAICSEVFSADSEQKPLINGELALPSNVCSDCNSKIDKAYELHQMCIESNRKLWEMLVTPVVSIKEENQDDVEVKPNQSQMTVFASELGELKVQKKKDVLNPRFEQCEKCEVTKKRAFAMYKHMKSKHPNDVLACNKCVAVFFDQDKLEKHKLLHDTDRPHQCPHCHKMFKTRRAITLHSVGCTGQTPFLCTECGKAYPYWASLHQHQLRHNEKKYVCTQCPSKFHTKGALQRHMVTHTKERKYQCELCDARFTVKESIATHMLIHAEKRARPHGCDLCDLRFTSKVNLNRHMRTHTGEKPYKCTHCDRAFTQSNDLVKHSKTHFGDKPYKCDRCDAQFRLMTDLRNHYKVHYQPGESADQSEPIQFTIVDTLNRRAKQEIGGNYATDEQLSAEQCEMEMI